MRKGFGRAVVVVTLIAFAGQGPAQSLDGCRSIVPPPFEAVSFEADIQPVFDRACVSCHQPASPDFAVHQLDLRPAQSYRALVDRPSRALPHFPLVQPFRPDGSRGSLLWWKVSCRPPPSGGVMPPGLLLTGAELRALYIWIWRGAPTSRFEDLAPVAPGPEHAGMWYDPSLPGHGFSFEITGDKPANVFGFWLTFGAGTDPSPGPDARWLTAVGAPLDDNTIALDFFQTTGGGFDAATAPPRTFPAGSGTLVFQDCSRAMLSYDVTLDDLPARRFARTIALRRLVARDGCVD